MQEYTRVSFWAISLRILSKIDVFYRYETELANEFWNLKDLEMRGDVSIYPCGGLFKTHLTFSLDILARKIIVGNLKPYSLEHHRTHVSLSRYIYLINFGWKI
jgi:hypothetical protein